jgi:hypothetical protein
MERTKSPKVKPWLVKVKAWPDQLSGDKHPHQHPDDPPDHSHDGKLFDHPDIVFRLATGACDIATHCIFSSLIHSLEPMRVAFKSLNYSLRIIP